MEFGILGPLEIRRDGRAVACNSAKQRLLLAVLLLRANEVVSSDRLIEALWGELPPPTAAKALQMHVSQLRRVLEPELLVTRPPGYELRVDPEQLDLHRFEALVGAARAAGAAGRHAETAELLASALALWRGPPLADLTFEECLQSEIARLEELRLATMERRIDADLALARHAVLVPELEALTAEHPLREGIIGALMLALYRSGRQADALEVYRQTRRRLVDELGLEPNRELKTLEERILAQDPELDAPEQAEPPLPGEGLIGRDKELAELLPLVDAAVGGHGAVLLIGGEPGIGKSRLADGLARHAARRGATVAVGRCWEAGGAPPFWPWAQALQTLRGGDDGLAQLFGDSEQPPEEDAGGRFRMFAAVTAFLARTAEDRPVALFLDDIHAADPGSLLLLRFAASQLAEMAVLLVACFRDTEMSDTLTETLAELRREPVFRHLSLSGLDAQATAGLLAATLGSPPDGDLVERVQAETRGNPLFAGEIARLLVAEGARDLEHLPIPDSIRDAIRRRVAGQSETCREFLVLASVLGREFDLATLSRLAGLDEESVSAALDEATAARLVGKVPGGHERLRFAHILVRDVLYDDLPMPRRLRLHHAVGEALEDLHGANPDPHMAELAHHFVAAGSLGLDKSAGYAERAGDVAAARYAYEEAARHYEVALDLLEESGPPAADHVCELLLSLGDAHSRAGDSASAKRALRRAAAIAEEHDWRDRLVRAAVAYGGRFAWPRASTDPALVPLLERGLAVADPDDLRARARLLARLAAAFRDEPSRDRRERLAEEAVAIGRLSGDPVALAYALEGYGVAREGVRPADELHTAGELIDLGVRLGDMERVFTGRDFRLNALWKLCDRAGVDVETDALNALAAELHQPGQLWSAATASTAVALMEGRFEEGEQLIAETRAIGERAESWNAQVSERLQLFVLHRAQGRLAELEDTIARSTHEYPTLIRFKCALAHLYAELGDLRAARAALDQMGAHDLSHEFIDAEWLFAVSMLPDVYRALGDSAAAGKLYDALLPYERLYAQAPIEATFGSVARALGVLAATLERFEAAMGHLELAIETERRMRARPWVAHAQHEMAAALAAAGDREHAAGFAAEAADGYRLLGMETWAGRVAGLGDPFPPRGSASP